MRWRVVAGCCPGSAGERGPSSSDWHSQKALTWPGLVRHAPGRGGPPLRLGVEALESGETRTQAGRVVDYAFDGERHRAPSPDAWPDHTRPSILFVGESILQGYGLDWDETLPAIVSKALDAQPVVLGVDGYASDQAFLRFYDTLPQYEHVVAVVTVFFPRLVDCVAWVDHPRLAFDGDEPHVTPGPPSLWSDLRLMRVARETWPWRDADAVQLTGEILRQTAKLAHARGARSLFSRDPHARGMVTRGCGARRCAAGEAGAGGPGARVRPDHRLRPPDRRVDPEDGRVRGGRPETRFVAGSWPGYPRGLARGSSPAPRRFRRRSRSSACAHRDRRRPRAARARRPANRSTRASRPLPSPRARRGPDAPARPRRSEACGLADSSPGGASMRGAPASEALWAATRSAGAPRAPS